MANGDMSNSSPLWHRQAYPVQQHSTLYNAPGTEHSDMVKVVSHVDGVTTDM